MWAEIILMFALGSSWCVNAMTLFQAGGDVSRQFPVCKLPVPTSGEGGRRDGCFTLGIFTASSESGGCVSRGEQSLAACKDLGERWPL